MRFYKTLMVCGLISLSQSAFAGGIASSMKDFWHGAGGISNFNGPTAYEAQSAGYYSMGSLYARTPVHNAKLASINMPSMKAGCGGIDMHNGSFSFINSGEINKTMKAIANNSTGFAMQLAMETFSPVIAEKVEELMTWMQRVNAMNINSCETAASLVGGMWPRHERASQNICSTLSNSSGLASDYAQAKHNCFADKGGTHNQLKSNEAIKDLYNQLKVEDINLAWKALKDSGFISIKDKETEDTHLAELFMTLSGTIIIRSNGDTPQYEVISGRAAHNDILEVMMEGGEIKLHKCDTTDKCLNVAHEGGVHRISTDEAFKAKIEKIMFSIIHKIQIDEALSDDEKSFINNKAQIPIYKILNVYAAYSGADAIFELPIYSEAIATQLLFEYLNDILRQVEVASDALIIASDDHLQKFKDNIKNVKKAIAVREQKTHQTITTLMTLVERTQVIEGIIANRLGSALADSFQWSKNL